jgi:aryl-alcohol dehydrogenase-like predicted oxidoreductase
MPDMRFRQLGRTGLRVSEICLGTMTFGSKAGPRTVPGTDESESLNILGEYLDRGGNFVDTADGYASGRSEEIVGKGLKGRRDRVVLATKVFFPTGDAPTQKGLSRKHILEGVDASLRRLGTDYIDLYQVHCFDPTAPLEVTLHALDALVQQGKVRYIGCSNFSGWQLAKALGISERLGYERFECLQPQYSLVTRSPDRELMPLCRSEQVGAIAWSPLGGGFLSGKYKAGQPPPERSRLSESDPANKVWVERFLTDRNFKILAVVEDAAQQLGKTVAQVALGWLLRVPGMTSVIIGARTREHLEQNLGACGWDFPTELWSRLDQASALPIEYPQDFQAVIGASIVGDG